MTYIHPFHDDFPAQARPARTLRMMLDTGGAPTPDPDKYPRRNYRYPRAYVAPKVIYWTLVWLLVILCLAGMFASFDAMMREDARQQCLHDGGNLTAQETQDVCRQAGIAK